MLDRLKSLDVAALCVLTLFGAACSSKVAGLKNSPDGTQGVTGLKLSIVGASKVTLGLGKVAELQTLLTLADQPVAGARVDYAIDGNAGGSILGANTMLTDDNGTASGRLVAGQTKAKFRVIAQTEGAAPVFFDVDVDGKYLGNVVVRTGYSGPLKIASIEVRLHDGRIPCSSLRYDALPTAVATQTAANVNLDVRFNNLQDKQKLIASVVAKSTAGRTLATGCGPTNGPVEVAGQRDTIINVSLEQAEPSLVGKYDFGQTVQPLDFMDQDTLVWVVLHDVTALLKDPAGTVLRDLYTFENGKKKEIGLCTLISSNPADTLRRVCEDTGTQLLTIALDAALNADGTGTATNIKNALADAARLITELRVGGGLDIKTYDKNTGNFGGELVWDAYNFVWRWGCTTSTDPCCGHQVFDGGSMGLSPMRAAVTGTAARNTAVQELRYSLTVNDAEIGLAYGRLAISLLENAIFPAIFTVARDASGKPIPSRFDPNGDGKFPLTDVLNGLLNCQALTDSNQRLVCDAATNAIGQYLVTGLLSQLSFNGTPDWNVKESLVGELGDTDLDLQTDQLSGRIVMKGTFNGVQVTSLPQDLDGRFVGTICQGDNDSDPDPIKSNGCPAGMACRFARHPVDGCFSQNFCGVPTGTRVGYDSCLNDNECFSGTCMKTPPPGYSYTNVAHCFQACKDDAQCGGNGHCDPTGYLAVEDLGSLGKSSTDVATSTGTCVR